jgi:hypothetical protein
VMIFPVLFCRKWFGLFGETVRAAGCTDGCMNRFFHYSFHRDVPPARNPSDFRCYGQDGAILETAPTLCKKPSLHHAAAVLSPFNAHKGVGPPTPDILETSGRSPQEFMAENRKFRSLRDHHLKFSLFCGESIRVGGSGARNAGRIPAEVFLPTRGRDSPRPASHLFYSLRPKTFSDRSSPSIRSP